MGIILNKFGLSLFFEVIFQLKWNIGNHILNWIIMTRCYYMYIHYYHTIIIQVVGISWSPSMQGTLSLHEVHKLNEHFNDCIAGGD